MSFHCETFVLLPLAALILVPGGILVCYGIAVSYGHVPALPQLAYISDVGTYPPESCFFTLCFVLGSICTFLSMLLFFAYLKYNGVNSTSNYVSLSIGSITCLGIIMVGSFQEKNIHPLHIAGATFAFLGAVIYGLFNIYNTIKYSSSIHDNKAIIIIRIILVSINTISGILFLIAHLLREFQTEGDRFRDFAIVTEWLLAYTSFASLATLAYELRNIRAVNIKLMLFSEKQRLLDEVL